MTDSIDPTQPPTGDVPIESVPMEVEAPRRAASAQFVVDAQVGSEAAMREAMDPANQSLAEALRLSYRVLQGVIVVLVILFATSGLQRIEPDQSGVMLRFGAIQESGAGGESLEPGWKISLWPYPAGEFVLIDGLTREVDLGDAFWPRLNEGQTKESAIENASAGVGLRPGVDGYLVLKGGDIAHLKLKASYAIDRPADLLRAIRPDAADKVVELAVRSATVNVAAGLALQDITDLTEDTKRRIREAAQATLDTLGGAASGLRLTTITITDSSPAFSIAKAQLELQNARENARNAVEEARRRAEQELIRAAGPDHALFSALIEQFEGATERGEAAEAERLLAQIGAAMEGPQAAGDVVTIIEQARNYRAQIETSVGTVARLFDSLLPAFEADPRLVVTTEWMETFARVLSREDTEVFFVPHDVSGIRVNLDGLEAVARLRLENLIDAQNAALVEEMRGATPYIAGGEKMGGGRASRRTNVKDGQIIEPRNP